jgi:hypothetical protein
LVGVGGPPGCSSTLTFWLWIVHSCHSLVIYDRIDSVVLSVNKLWLFVCRNHNILCIKT